jgi:hypothetical protein
MNVGPVLCYQSRVNECGLIVSYCGPTRGAIFNDCGPETVLVFGPRPGCFQSITPNGPFISTNPEYLSRQLRDTTQNSQQLDTAIRVPPRSVQKLGIKALKLMMGKRMCLKKCKFQFFLHI